MRNPLPLALASILATAVPALAQPVKPLGLGEAIAQAQANSTAAQASRQQVVIAEVGRAQTLAGALPEVGLQASANYQDLGGAAAGLGNAFGAIAGFPANGAYLDTSLSASQVLFDNFATRDQLEIDDRTIAIGKLAQVQAEQDAMQEAAVAYFDVLRAEGFATTADEGVRQAHEHLRLGEIRFAAGTATRADVLRQRAQLADAQGTLTQQRNAVDLARLTLGNALNAPVGDRALDAGAAVPPVVVSLGQDLGAALDRRTEVKQLEARQQVDETRARREGRALDPRLYAGGRYAQRNLFEGQFQAGVTLNWSVFDSFRVRHKVAAATEQVRLTGIQLEKTRQRVALEIRKAYQTRQEASQRVGIAREGLQAAQEAYRLVRKHYQLGSGTAFDVTDAQTTLIRASNNYVQAVHDLRTAEVRLARALGLDLAAMLRAAAK